MAYIWSGDVASFYSYYGRMFGDGEFPKTFDRKKITSWKSEMGD